MEIKINFKDKGVTLVTLVITIIIILILAGITLETAIGKNGLMDKTKQAVDTYKKSEVEESEKIETLSKLLEDNNFEIDENSNIQELIKNMKDMQEEIENLKQQITQKEEEKNPTGTVISYMGNTPPKGYLNCDGTTYNIEDYPELADQINKEFGSYSYFGGDGETTFAVPNLQGEFLRGYSKDSKLSKTNGVTTAKVGEHQNGTKYATLGNHYASVNDCWIGSYIGTGGLSTSTSRNQDTNIGSSVGILITLSNSCYINNSANFLKQPTAYTGRPTNTTVLYCIKY